MSDIKRAVERQTAKLVKHTINAVKAVIDLKTNEKGMVRASELKEALDRVFSELME